MKTMLKMSLISSTLMGALFFLLPSVSFAQSVPSGHFVLVSQGIVDTESTTTVGRYTTQIGSGYVGTTTGAFMYGINNTSGATWQITLTGYPTSSYTSGSQVSEATFTTTVTTVGGSPDFVQLGNCSDFFLSQPGCVFNPSNFYTVSSVVNSGDANYFGASLNTKGWVVSARPSGDGLGLPYFAIVGDGFQITPTASSSGIFLSGAVDFCNGAFASSTGIGATISNGFCIALGYLFVPTADSVQQFSNLSVGFKQVIPFSYFTQIYSLITSLSASTTENLPTFTIPFPQLGSTSPIGNIVPAEITWFSTTTISTYYPDSLRETFLFLGASALWFGLLVSIYKRVRFTAGAMADMAGSDSDFV